jgi:hypothetical protein
MVGIRGAKIIRARKFKRKIPTRKRSGRTWETKEDMLTSSG